MSPHWELLKVLAIQANLRQPRFSHTHPRELLFEADVEVRWEIPVAVRQQRAHARIHPVAGLPGALGKGFCLWHPEALTELKRKE